MLCKVCTLPRRKKYKYTRKESPLFVAPCPHTDTAHSPPLSGKGHNSLSLMLVIRGPSSVSTHRHSTLTAPLRERPQQSEPDAGHQGTQLSGQRVGIQVRRPLGSIPWHGRVRNRLSVAPSQLLCRLSLKSLSASGTLISFSVLCRLVCA